MIFYRTGNYSSDCKGLANVWQALINLRSVLRILVIPIVS
jgi:hypothetical protein